MLAKDLVVKDVVAIDPEKDVLDALYTMFKHRVRILSVFSDGKFRGILAIADYIKVLKELGNRKPESMLVKEIMNERLRTVSPNTDISYVIDSLCEKGVYGVPVISGHEFIGIIRREDLLKRFLPLFRGKFKVMDVMSYYVSTNSIHDTIETIAKRIVAGVDRRVIIMDNDKVEGTVTIEDLANVVLADKVDFSSLSVKDVLTPNPATVRKSDDAAKAVDIMLDWCVGGVPVVDRQLEGVIRDKDVIQRIHILI